MSIVFFFLQNLPTGAKAGPKEPSTWFLSCHNIAINFLTILAVRWNWTMVFVALIPKQQVRLPTGKDLPVSVEDCLCVVDAQGSLVLREASNKISSIVSHLQHLSQIMYCLDPPPQKKQGWIVDEDEQGYGKQITLDRTDSERIIVYGTTLEVGYQVIDLDASLTGLFYSNMDREHLCLWPNLTACVFCSTRRLVHCQTRTCPPGTWPLASRM